MYVYTNDLLIKRMNEYEMFFGESGYVQTDESWGSKNVCSPFSRIYYVDSGKALLRTADTEIIMEPGYIYLIPAGLTYDYEGMPSVHKLFFHVNIFKTDGYDMMLEMKEVGILKSDLEYMEMLRKLYDSDSFSSAVLLRGYVGNTVSEMISKYGIGKDRTESYSVLVQNTMKYIINNLSVKLNIAEIADHAFVSVSTLTKVFKEQTGRTVGSYIDDLVMYSAQRKLLRTDMPVSEVSEKLGFCDQFYFSRYFKKRCGESPLKYRKRMKTVDFGAEPEITPVKKQWTVEN